MKSRKKLYRQRWQTRAEKRARRRRTARLFAFPANVERFHREVVAPLVRPIFDAMSMRDLVLVKNPPAARSSVSVPIPRSEGS